MALTELAILITALATSIGAAIAYANYRQMLKALDPVVSFSYGFKDPQGDRISASLLLRNRNPHLMRIDFITIRKPWPVLAQPIFTLSSSQLLDSEPLSTPRRTLPVNIEVSPGSSQGVNFLIFWHSQDKRERKLRLEISISLMSRRIKNIRIPMTRFIPRPPANIQKTN